MTVRNPYSPGDPMHLRYALVNRLEVDVTDFWSARYGLGHIHDFARARRVAPWAVLGGVLARVVAGTKPFVQLPPTIGSHASLNLFVGLVAPSGGGKDAAAKVARDAIEVNGFDTVPLGSGEGLSHMFMKDTKEGPELYRDAVLVTLGEIDTLTALVKRQSSTVASQLRQAAMGEQLGFFYVDVTKRMIVPEHRYRMCLVAGIQPKRAGDLLEDADGGTPQRFVWLPATDPDAPDDAPECPDPLVWEPPKWHAVPSVRVGGMDRVVMPVCEEATDTIVAAHLARVRGQGDSLDGHSLLTRLKVAAALAILDGRTAVEGHDWDLSAVVMQVSDETRNGVVRALEDETKRRNHAQAEAEAARTIVVQERLDDAAVQRVARGIKRTLAKGEPWVKGADLRRSVAGTKRQYLDPALTALLLSGEVVEEETHNRGQKGTRYRLAGSDE